MTERAADCFDNLALWTAPNRMAGRAALEVSVALRQFRCDPLEERADYRLVLPTGYGEGAKKTAALVAPPKFREETSKKAVRNARSASVFMRLAFW